jgi:hypothetical protein
MSTLANAKDAGSLLRLSTRAMSTLADAKDAGMRSLSLPVFSTVSEADRAARQREQDREIEVLQAELARWREEEKMTMVRPCRRCIYCIAFCSVCSCAFLRIVACVVFHLQKESIPVKEACHEISDYLSNVLIEVLFAKPACWCQQQPCPKQT